MHCKLKRYIIRIKIIYRFDFEIFNIFFIKVIPQEELIMDADSILVPVMHFQKVRNWFINISFPIYSRSYYTKMVMYHYCCITISEYLTWIASSALLNCYRYGSSLACETLRPHNTITTRLQIHSYRVYVK